MDNKIVDMINAAAEGNGSDFMSAVQDELNTRIMNQIETGRQEYVDTVFGGDQEEMDFDSDDEIEETEEEISDEEV